MPHRAEFESDAFISYAHIDDAEFSPEDEGWVTELHRVLQRRLAQLLGRESKVWRDPTIQENDDFAKLILERVKSTAALIAVVSPRYVRSEWALRELTAFCEAAQQQGGLLIGEKARVFKVLKTPVAREEHPPQLQPFLGYEFYKTDPETGRTREFWQVFGADSKRQFYEKVCDLAHDVQDVVDLLDDDEPPRSGDAVYLAVSTGDVKEQWELIRRGLQQRGYTVLPNRPLPLAAAELEAAVREDLARCRLSIHMFGNRCSLIPEGGEKSLVEIQHDLANERASRGSFPRLLWIPPGLKVEDARQQDVVERLRTGAGLTAGADLLETPLQDLETLIQVRLNPVEQNTGKTVSTPTPGGAPVRQLYLIFDKRDAELIKPWETMLFSQGVEVIPSEFDGDEAEVRKYHLDNLRDCDGALIFYGSANEMWLRGKLREIKKSAGYGRTQPIRAVGICLIAPKTADKECFLTHEAMLIPQWDGPSADSLKPFLSRLLADVEGGGAVA